MELGITHQEGRTEPEEVRAELRPKCQGANQVDTGRCPPSPAICIFS